MQNLICLLYTTDKMQIVKILKKEHTITYNTLKNIVNFYTISE